MKNTIILTIFFLFQNSNVCAQDKSEINQKWTELKDQFKHKTEVVFEFTSKLQKSKKIDKKELEKTDFYASEFSKVFENKVLNKEIVSKVKQANDLLNTYLVRILVDLESDFKLKSQESIISLYDQLSTIENLILADIMRYNEVCIKQNSKVLIFKTHDKNGSHSIEF